MPDEEAVVTALRDAGAVFGYLHGSRVTGAARPESDLKAVADRGRR